MNFFDKNPIDDGVSTALFVGAETKQSKNGYYLSLKFNVGGYALTKAVFPIDKDGLESPGDIEFLGQFIVTASGSTDKSHLSSFNPSQGLEGEALLNDIATKLTDKLKGKELEINIESNGRYKNINLA